MEHSAKSFEIQIPVSGFKGFEIGGWGRGLGAVGIIHYVDERVYLGDIRHGVVEYTRRV